MITIYKGDQKARVPSGSFKTHFAPYGWSKEPVERPTELPKAAPEGDPGKHTSGPEAGSTGGSTASGEDLSKMSDEALKQYASLLGIKTKDLKSREEVLKAIEAAQK